MSYENRKWVIITLSDYTSEELEEMVSNAIQTSVNTFMKTLDNTKAVLKWDGSTPSVFNGLTQYTHSEIISILRSEEWQESE